MKEAEAAGGPAVPAAGEDRGGSTKRLARVYESMKPKEAAAVLEKLERPMAAQLLREIRDKQASKILAAMTPATAAELSRHLAQPIERKGS